MREPYSRFFDVNSCKYSNVTGGPSCRVPNLPPNAKPGKIGHKMTSPNLPSSIAALPKAELHLHLEGSIRPAIARQLALRSGVDISEQEIRCRYIYSNFTEFIEAFKWVTSFLRKPTDFALLAADVAEQLLQQNVIYAELTLSVGIMLLRNQNPQENFEAMLAATKPYEQRGLHMNWIFDAVRQFGAEAAMDVVEWAGRCASPRIVAFGIGGDELSLPTRAFQKVYERAGELGMHRLIHAGEIGGPEKIREAIDLLGAERIGHGIAAIHDPSLMDLVIERGIPMEVCPVSNLRTGALALQVEKDATLNEHPLLPLFRRGVPIVLSTDDPAMFHTSLIEEYAHAYAMGLTEKELTRLIAQGFQHAFVTPEERARLFPSPPKHCHGEAHKQN
jgi:aminodeoxyfutalosine deaminase